MSTRQYGRKARMRTASAACANTESVEMLTVDPYGLIDCPQDVCVRGDHSRKQNCSRNPWCVYGLGEYKEGIWKTDVNILKQLGKDPRQDIRCTIHINQVSTESSTLGIDSQEPAKLDHNSTQMLIPPVGLRNLGATCYLNVLVQALFHNLLMRNSILNIETVDVEGEQSSRSNMIPVIDELRRIFARMLLTRHRVVDLERFTELLSLNNCVQQDPQEFNKLFLAKLEGLNFSVADPNLPKLQQLLSGILKFSTRCNRCGTVRSNEMPFRELDLNVHECNSLSGALAALLRDEELVGANQYECAVCHCKCDAVRSTEILETPVVLNIYLLRYYYDRDTLERKKVTNQLQFPTEISIADRKYKLVAAFYHRGSTAYGGHFLCEILDWGTGQWWLCDDESVQRTMDPSYAQDAPKSKASSGNSKKRKSSCIDLTIDEDNTGPSGHADMKCITRSKDAYMLSYVVCHAMQRSACLSPPEPLATLVRKENTTLLEHCRSYEVRLNQVTLEIEQRKRDYLSIKDHLVPIRNPSGTANDFRIVPSSWLRSWITGAPNSFKSLPPQGAEGHDAYGIIERGRANIGISSDTSMQSLICPHGKGLAMDAVEKIKILSMRSFAIVQQTHATTVDYDLNGNNFRCAQCFDKQIDIRGKLLSLKTQYSHILELIDKDSDYDINNSMEFVWLSKQFVSKLKKSFRSMQKVETERTRTQTGSRRVNFDVGAVSEIPAHNEVNDSLLCEHGKLLLRFERKAIKISCFTWSSLLELFRSARRVSSNEEPCEICRGVEESTQIQRSIAKYNRALEVEEKEMQQLLKRKRTVIAELTTSDSSFAAIDGIWLAHWRKYISDANFPPPPALTNNALICPHGNSVLSDVIRRVWEDGNADENVYELGEDNENAALDNSMLKMSERVQPSPTELISIPQWKQLIRYHCDQPMLMKSSEDNIEAKVNEVIGKPICCAWEGKFVAQWDPPICTDCTDAIHLQHLQAYSSYNGITMEVVFMNSVDDISCLIQFHSNARKRPARRRCRGTFSIVVDSTDSIALVKLKIFEACSQTELLPAYQALYGPDGHLLDSEAKTLAAFNILADQRLYVCELRKDVLNSTIGDSFSDYFNTHFSSARDENGAFNGTLLVQDNPQESSKSDRAESLQHRRIDTAGVDKQYEEDLLIAIEKSKNCC